MGPLYQALALGSHRAEGLLPGIGGSRSRGVAGAGTQGFMVPTTEPEPLQTNSGEKRQVGKGGRCRAQRDRRIQRQDPSQSRGSWDCRPQPLSKQTGPAFSLVGPSTSPPCSPMSSHTGPQATSGGTARARPHLVCTEGFSKARGMEELHSHPQWLPLMASAGLWVQRVGWQASPTHSTGSIFSCGKNSRGLCANNFCPFLFLFFF